MAAGAYRGRLLGVFQVRLHGRGGQGVITSANLLAIAAFRDGRDAQSFPLFGSERTGAPVMAFCRIDDREIRRHEPIGDPDALVVHDATLVGTIDLSAPLVVVNSTREIEAPGRVITVAATAIAREHVVRPLPGTALLGALVAATGATSFAALEAAIRDRFPGAIADGNVAAARAAYDTVLARA
jgi:pyruvate ferredoxin oxidoreductase gamma subunit